MNISTFLSHHGLVANPFAAEEARQDQVFSRLEDEFHHPDFEKICGDLSRPSAAVVFGERGSGKTAIRLQMLRRLRDHNVRAAGRSGSDGSVMGIAYDDFDPIIAALARHGGDAGKAIGRLTLADHLDALLGLAVPAVVDAVVEGRVRSPSVTLDLGPEAAKRARGLDRRQREDLLSLQALYDRPEDAAARTGRLRRIVRLRSGDRARPLLAVAGFASGIALVLLVWSLLAAPESRLWAWNLGIGAFGAVALATGCWGGWLWLRRWSLARELAKAVRTSSRSAASYRATLAGLPSALAEPARLPRGSDDEPRFAMLGRLIELLRAFDHAGLVVVVDRVDEPTAVAGDPDRMRPLVWPLFSSKLLQLPGLGIKMLLPSELRPMLAREASEFFRGARLDKQNLVERLVWPGATLYDLCSARMNACRATVAGRVSDATNEFSARVEASEPPSTSASLADLFDESMRPQDLVDALDQLQQPRDAFKFLYQCLQEHCGAVPDETPVWRIPRPLFDAVRKREVVRMQEMLKGVRAG